jgi:hypothetical protein
MVPRTGTVGTHVKVPSGKWRAVHNSKNSLLTLLIDGNENDINTTFDLAESATIQVKVAKGGTENFILAYLEAA